MTFIAGYIYKNSVQIVSDSAVTGPKRPENHDIPNLIFCSSFRETVHISGDQAISESANKLNNIDGRILIAYAGLTSEGDGTLRDLILRFKVNFGKPISHVIKEYFAENIYKNSQYIIGFNEEDKPHLFVCYENGRSYLENNRPGIAFAGVFPYNIHESAKWAFQWASKLGYSEDETLVFMQALLQTISVTNRTIEYRVGGHFNGALVSREGVRWSRDTLYIMYSTNNFELGDKFIVAKYNRENSTFLIGNDSKWLFHPSIGSNSKEEVKKKWNDSIHECYNNELPDFCVFISYDKRTVVSISNESGKNHRIERVHGGIQIPYHIKIEMNKYLNPPDGTIGIYTYSNFIK
ncbi:MAG: hypothetical protein J0L67_18715 [Cytophagales bacterium]|nr:hypothetical protein [Cytophagales bacterium]